MIFGAILAGGTGTRMGNADMPKQFLPLGDKPIVIYSLEKFLMCHRVDYVYIGVHQDWVGHMQELVDRFVPEQKDRVCVVVGGADRNSTIQNMIEAIECDHGAKDEHIIVTHDSVRPFFTMQMLEENIDAAIKYGAVDTVLPAIDTIVVSDDGKFITEIPERYRMFQGQTPQSFRITDLKRLYATLTEEEKGILTDACKICTIRNYPVYLVKGSGLNFKITTPADYELAQALVSLKNEM